MEKTQVQYRVSSRQRDVRYGIHAIDGYFEWRYIKSPGALLMVTLGQTTDKLADLRRYAFVAKFAFTQIGFTDPGIAAPIAPRLCCALGQKRSAELPAAFTPVPGETLRFIVPGCEVVTALNANVVDKSDLEADAAALALRSAAADRPNGCNPSRRDMAHRAGRTPGSGHVAGLNLMTDPHP
jgi:hypothetical protein